MKNFIILLSVLLVIFISAGYAQQYDSQSASAQQNQYSPDNINSPYSQYNQYSPDNINNPYSQYNQYSPKNINNPYSQYNQYSPNDLNDPFAKRAKDFTASVDLEKNKAMAGKKAKAGKKTKKSTAANFFYDSKPKKGVSVFFYLLILSSLAVGLTLFIIVSLFKK